MDGAPDALLRLIPMRAGYCSQGSETDAYRRSPSGTTCEPSTGAPGLATSTSSAAGSRVRTSAQPAAGRASRAKSPVCGPSSLGSLARFDPATSSWKTLQTSLLAGLDAFLGTWPRWGMMRAGECWELPTPARLTSGTGSGLWPTPMASMGERGGRGDLLGMVRQYPSVEKRYPATFARHFPTPRAPSISGGGTGLDGGSGARKMLTDQERKELCGAQLNPAWVELLMGWPKGWTALDACAAAAPPDMPWKRAWEDGTPRVERDIQHRADRLRCIGNGQVPAVVRLAWANLHETPRGQNWRGDALK